MNFRRIFMKRKTIEKFIFYALNLFLGGCIGILVGRFFPINATFIQKFSFYLILVCFFYFVLYFHIFIHELGHLVFGLISGYKFSSIRFLSFIFFLENGKLKLKKLKLAGTGGQCLMIPPKLDGTSPVCLYNWGGCLANLIFSIIFLVVACFSKSFPTLKVFFEIFSICGFIVAVTNGIPFKTLSNDGYNAITLKKRFEARKAFEKSLYISKEIAGGKRIKDVDVDFCEYDEKFYDDNMVVMSAMQTLNYYVDKCEFEKAYEFCKKLYEKAFLIDIHKLVVISELINSILLTDKDKSEIDQIFTKENKSLLKKYKALPPVHRVLYVYELLYNNNEENALKHKKDFEKIAKKYPYKQELVGEIEIMQLARSKFEEKNNSDLK